METETDFAAVCGDTRDGYTCNKPPHSASTDHAETRSTLCYRIPYVVAFWNYGQGPTGLDRLVVTR